MRTRSMWRSVAPAGRRRVRARRGSAVLVALALLALGAALLAGSAEAARSAARSVQSYEATIVAEAESRRAVAEFVAGWGPVHDSLAIDAGLGVLSGPTPRGAGRWPVTTRLRLLRLTQARYVIAVDCQVGPGSVGYARRRLQVTLERATPADTTAPSLPPTPIGRWGMADLY